MQGMSPSAIDFEIRSLVFDESENQLILFLEFLSNCFTQRKSIELLQAYLNVFLKASFSNFHIHGETLKQNASTFHQSLLEVQEQSKLCWSRMEKSFQGSICMIDFYTNSNIQIKA
jgi:hypothetical protein